MFRYIKGICIILKAISLFEKFSKNQISDFFYERLRLILGILVQQPMPLVQPPMLKGHQTMPQFFFKNQLSSRLKLLLLH